MSSRYPNSGGGGGQRIIQAYDRTQGRGQSGQSMYGDYRSGSGHRVASSPSSGTENWNPKTMSSSAASSRSMQSYSGQQSGPSNRYPRPKANPNMPLKLKGGNGGSVSNANRKKSGLVNDYRMKQVVLNFSNAPPSPFYYPNNMMLHAGEFMHNSRFSPPEHVEFYRGSPEQNGWSQTPNDQSQSQYFENGEHPMHQSVHQDVYYEDVPNPSPHQEGPTMPSNHGIYSNNENTSYERFDSETMKRNGNGQYRQAPNANYQQHFPHGQNGYHTPPSSNGLPVLSPRSRSVGVETHASRGSTSIPMRTHHGDYPQHPEISNNSNNGMHTGPTSTTTAATSPIHSVKPPPLMNRGKDGALQPKTNPSMHPVNNQQVSASAKMSNTNQPSSKMTNKSNNGSSMQSMVATSSSKTASASVTFSELNNNRQAPKSFQYVQHYQQQQTRVNGTNQMNGGQRHVNVALRDHQNQATSDASANIVPEEQTFDIKEGENTTTRNDEDSVTVEEIQEVKDQEEEPLEQDRQTVDSPEPHVVYTAE